MLILTVLLFRIYYFLMIYVDF